MTPTYEPGSVVRTTDDRIAICTRPDGGLDPNWFTVNTDGTNPQWRYLSDLGDDVCLINTDPPTVTAAPPAVVQTVGGQFEANGSSWYDDNEVQLGFHPPRPGRYEHDNTRNWS